MNNFKKQIKITDGFTITEIIVSINLGILLVGLIIGFYLFVLKTSYTTSKNISNNQEISQFLTILDSKLINADNFTINYEEEYKLLTLSSGQKIYFYDHFVLSNEDTILTNLDSMKFNLKSKHKLAEIDLKYKNSFESNEINKIDIQINNHFVFNYYVPKFNIKGLKNINEAD